MATGLRCFRMNNMNNVWDLAFGVVRDRELLVFMESFLVLHTSRDCRAISFEAIQAIQLWIHQTSIDADWQHRDRAICYACLLCLFRTKREGRPYISKCVWKAAAKCS